MWEVSVYWRVIECGPAGTDGLDSSGGGNGSLWAGLGCGCALLCGRLLLVLGKVLLFKLSLLRPQHPMADISFRI